MEQKAEITEERRKSIHADVDEIIDQGGFILLGKGHQGDMMSGELIIARANIIGVMMVLKGQFDEVLASVLARMGMRVSQSPTQGNLMQ